MNILLFEDTHVRKLAPVVTGRPAFAVSCGSFRLVDLVARLSNSVRFHVRPHLASLVSLDFPSSPPEPKGDSLTLCINARVAPTVSNLKALTTFSRQTEPAVIADEQSVLAALAPDSVMEELSQSDFSPAASCLADCRKADVPLEVIRHLHDLIRINSRYITENLEDRLAGGSYHEIADGVFAADPDATLGPHVVTESGGGPIVLETGFSIGPFSLIEGPVYLGPRCKVAGHSTIRDAVSAGSTCKLGGEIEATIVEGFSNKQHHGFLGHSYLGQWINLGAGTSNSDLKNTYGPINMQLDGQKIATGLQFVGCFLGDYTRTAINTSIFTGKSTGVCSTVYGFATGDVAAFTNDASTFGKVTEVSPQVMIQTQARMFRRRNVPQRECDKALIHSMFGLTADQRAGLSCEPIAW